MSASNPTLSDMQSAVKQTVRLHWQLFLTQGVIMLILGILAVIWPGISTIARRRLCRLAIPIPRHYRAVHDVPRARCAGLPLDAASSRARAVRRYHLAAASS